MACYQHLHFRKVSLPSEHLQRPLLNDLSYDNITGALYYDQDGSTGVFNQVKFAQLSAGLSLTNNNFVVV
ncbi:hypothetical protein [Nostoc sp.]|uniref:hypothetical protein n=1 Tax=Nostoc sp. TaxID=1180 RepID=UPI002FF9CA30